MDDLIAAFQIFRKYSNAHAPLNCSHDYLLVDVDPAKVSDEDKAALDKLGFFPDTDLDGFGSYRFGSC